MSKKNVKILLAVLCAVFAIAGCVFISKGFDKKDNYSNPDNEYSLDYDYDYINSYVGGDAYNYIINGTYFTAYAVLGMGFLIMSTITGVTYLLLSCKPKQENVEEAENNEENVADSSKENDIVEEKIGIKSCPECRCVVGDEAKECPNCGYPFE